MERDNRLTYSRNNYFWGISLLLVQNPTSYSCSATPISYKGDEILPLSRLVFKIWSRTDRWQTTDATSKT